MSLLRLLAPRSAPHTCPLAWQRILKYMPLTVAYANKGITIVWGMIWGAVLFNEAITLKTVIGAAIILVGIFMVVTNNEH